MKTDKQEMLEARRGKTIETLLIAALGKHRGRKNMMVFVASELEISVPTLGAWCRQFDI
ncbi:MAG: hypothetical protein IID01_01895, partial [Chloroflexi bacterium]|nr:hypothetical protein [Chloroflexota bacterium]